MLPAASSMLKVLTKSAEVVARRAMLSRARGKIMVKVLLFFEKDVSKEAKIYATSLPKVKRGTWRQAHFANLSSAMMMRDVSESENPKSKQARGIVSINEVTGHLSR